MKKTPIIINIPKNQERDKCDGVEPDHCEEIKLRKFTDNPEDLFEEVKGLEERYKYTLDTIKEKYNKEISEAQRINREKYRLALEKKKKELNEQVEKINKEIAKKIAVLEEEEVEIIKKIEKIYNENQESLEDSILKILGLNILKPN